MSVALEIQLAPLWREASKTLSSAGAAIVHADLDVRALQSMLALALEKAFEQEVPVALLLPTDKHLELAKWRLSEWMPEVKLQRVTDAFSLDGLLWLTTALDNVPVEVMHTYVVDAHLISHQPALSASALVAGVATTYGHWFDQYASLHITTSWNADCVCETWPDQECKRLSVNDPSYQQMMLLNAEPQKQTFVFRTFSRSRLKVRSDKGREFLSASQQEEARRQLGDEWSSGASGAPIVTLELTPLQKRYLAIKRRARQLGYRKFLLLKYRRGGLTTIEQALSYALIVNAPRSYVITLAHTKESTERIFRIATTYHECDPLAPRRIDDAKSRIELANGSLFFIGTAGGKGVARGDTLARAHGSEVSRWCLGPNQQKEVADLVAGLTGAASNGEVVLETTPNGNEWFAAAYRDAKRKLNSYFPIFLRWFDDPANVAAEGTYSEEEILETLTPEEKQLAAKHKLSVAQIAFRRTVQKDYKHLAAQEYPEDDEECFLNAGHCYFTLESLAKIRKLQEVAKKPYSSHQLPGGWLTIWEPPQPGVEYVAGADTSEGIPGCDPSGIGIARRDTGKQVASVHGIFKPEVLAEHAVTLCQRFNRALLGVERENHGHAVLLALAKLGYNTPHYLGGPLFYYAEGRAGWTTNGSTRPVMLDSLSSLLDDAPELVMDPELASECGTFRLQPKTGKFEADPGCHDDSVMKWAICERMRHVPLVKPGIRFLKGTV